MRLTPSVSVPGGLTPAALMIGVVLTLVLGVAPQPLLSLANRTRPRSSADIVHTPLAAPVSGAAEGRVAA